MNYFLAFLLSFNIALACDMTTHDQIVVIDADANLNQSIVKTNCDGEFTQRFVDFIKSANGVVANTVLKRIFPDINFTNDNIRFLDLTEHLQTSGQMSQNSKLLKARQLLGRGMVGIAKDQRFEVECKTCLSAGTHSAKLQIKDNLGQLLSTEWIKLEIGSPVQSYISKNTIAASLKPLNPSDFEQQTIYSSNPSFVADASLPLHFYKTSRSLSHGEVLMKRDISPIQLVKPGVAARVIVRDQSISIDGEATPLSFGVFGEMIKLKNPKSQRVIVGKVIDQNKVLLEL